VISHGMVLCTSCKHHSRDILIVKGFAVNLCAVMKSNINLVDRK